MVMCKALSQQPTQPPGLSHQANGGADISRIVDAETAGTLTGVAPAACCWVFCAFSSTSQDVAGRDWIFNHFAFCKTVKSNNFASKFNLI